MRVASLDIGTYRKKHNGVKKNNGQQIFELNLELLSTKDNLQFLCLTK